MFLERSSWIKRPMIYPYSKICISYNRSWTFLLVWANCFECCFLSPVLYLFLYCFKFSHSSEHQRVLDDDAIVAIKEDEAGCAGWKKLCRHASALYSLHNFDIHCQWPAAPDEAAPHCPCAPQRLCDCERRMDGSQISHGGELHDVGCVWWTWMLQDNKNIQ
jgi:hypothetical protein